MLLSESSESSNGEAEPMSFPDIFEMSFLPPISDVDREMFLSPRLP